MHKLHRNDVKLPVHIIQECISVNAEIKMYISMTQETYRNNKEKD